MGSDGARLTGLQRSILEFLDRCDGGHAKICEGCIAGAVAGEPGEIAEALGTLREGDFVAYTPGDGYHITTSGRLVIGEPALQPA